MPEADNREGLSDELVLTGESETHEARILRAARNIDLTACLEITDYSDEELRAALTSH